MVEARTACWNHFLPSTLPRYLLLTCSLDLKHDTILRRDRVVVGSVAVGKAAQSLSALNFAVRIGKVRLRERVGPTERESR
jgi:hypothetical protein